MRVRTAVCGAARGQHGSYSAMAIPKPVETCPVDEPATNRPMPRPHCGCRTCSTRRVCSTAAAAAAALAARAAGPAARRASCTACSTACSKATARVALLMAGVDERSALGRTGRNRQLVRPQNPQWPQPRLSGETDGQAATTLARYVDSILPDSGAPPAPHLRLLLPARPLPRPAPQQGLQRRLRQYPAPGGGRGSGGRSGRRRRGHHDAAVQHHCGGDGEVGVDGHVVALGGWGGGGGRSKRF